MTKLKLDLITANRYLLIHKAIHNPKSKYLVIAGEKLEIKTDRYGARCVKWIPGLFIQHLPMGTSSLSRLAAQGRQVTHIKRTGEEWGLIIDKKILRA